MVPRLWMIGQRTGLLLSIMQPKRTSLILGNNRKFGWIRSIFLNKFICSKVCYDHSTKAFQINLYFRLWLNVRTLPVTNRLHLPYFSALIVQYLNTQQKCNNVNEQKFKLLNVFLRRSHQIAWKVRWEVIVVVVLILIISISSKFRFLNAAIFATGIKPDQSTWF